MGLAGLSAYRLSRRLNGWCAAIVAALIDCRLHGRTILATAKNASADEKPRRINVVEPIGQRSPYGNYLAGRFAERQKDLRGPRLRSGAHSDDFPDNVGLVRRTFYLSLEAGQTDTALRLARRLDESGAKVATAQLLLAAESVREGGFRERVAASGIDGPGRSGPLFGPARACLGPCRRRRDGRRGRGAGAAGPGKRIRDASPSA